MTLEFSSNESPTLKEHFGPPPIVEQLTQDCRAKLERMGCDPTQIEKFIDPFTKRIEHACEAIYQESTSEIDTLRFDVDLANIAKEAFEKNQTATEEKLSALGAEYRKGLRSMVTSGQDNLDLGITV